MRISSIFTPKDDTCKKLKNVQDQKKKPRLTHTSRTSNMAWTPNFNESSVKFGCNLNVDQTPCFWSTPNVGISKLHIGKPSSKNYDKLHKRPRVGQEVFPNHFPWDRGLLSSILFVIKISFTTIFNPQFLFNLEF